MKPEDAKNIINELIALTGIPTEETDFAFDDESGHYWFRINTRDSRFFIGKDGETLKALNYIFRKIFESKNTEESNSINVLIDVNNYQKTRIESLKATAHMMAERARYFKSNIEIDPMSAFERRIIHTFLESKTDIKTESTGIGPQRRVVIKYIGNI